MRREAFVTYVEGVAYDAWYRRHVFEAQQRFAQAAGRPLLVLTPGDFTRGDRALHPDAPWEKLRIFDAPKTQPYERLCWLDADVYPMRGAPNPFEVPSPGWLAVDNNTCATVEQGALDATWYWFLPRSERPSVLINSGFFVAERAAHAALFRFVWDAWCGRWEQAPWAFHLLHDVPGRLVGSVFNRVVLHHLAREGHGPLALASLVSPPGFIHFAGRTAAENPVYPAYVAAADDGALLRRLALTTRHTTTQLKWELQKRLPSGLRAWSDPLRLRRSLSKTRRLHVSPHGGVVPGWTSVDVQSTSGSHEKFQRTGLSRGALGDALDAAAHGLASVFFENVLEAQGEAAQRETLRRALVATEPQGTLIALCAGRLEESSSPYAATANRRYTAQAPVLAAAAREAGWRHVQVHHQLSLDGTIRPLPTGAFVLRAQRP